MQALLMIVNILGQALAIFVVFYVLLQMLFPNSSVQGALSRVIDPLLDPIRKRVKPFKGFDFSALILLVLILIAEIILTAIIGSFIK